MSLTSSQSVETFDNEGAEESPPDDFTEIEESPKEDDGRFRGSVLPTGMAISSMILALTSLSGSWASQMLAERLVLASRISHQGRGMASQIDTLYLNPWHTTALTNGAFAATALLMATIVLVHGRGGRTSQLALWVRGAAFTGIFLGFMGLVIALIMRFDMLAPLPAIPS